MIVAVRPFNQLGTIGWRCALALVSVLALAMALIWTGGGARTTDIANRGLSGLPSAARGPVSSSLGADLPGYAIVGSWARNPAQRFSAEFSSAGVTVASATARVRLAIAGLGRAGALRAVAPARPVADANRVLYAHRGLREWWANGPLGLEQGFVVRDRPRGGAGPLEVSLALSGRSSRTLSSLIPRASHRTNSATRSLSPAIRF